MTLRHLFALAAVLASFALPGVASAQRTPWRYAPVTTTTTVYRGPVVAQRPVYARPYGR